MGCNERHAHWQLYAQRAGRQNGNRDRDPRNDRYDDEHDFVDVHYTKYNTHHTLIVLDPAMCRLI